MNSLWYLAKIPAFYQGNHPDSLPKNEISYSKLCMINDIKLFWYVLQEGIMKIVRSTIAANDILKTIQDNYNDFPHDTVCMFEYRGLNDVYKCSNGNLSFFFKIYARDRLDPQEIQAEVEILNHLRHSGLPVAHPIQMQDGQYLLPIHATEKTRFGVMWSEAEGIPYHNDRLDENAIIRISYLISNMHSMLDAIPTAPHRWNLDEHLFLDHSIEILENYHQFNPFFDLAFLQQVAKELKEQIRNNAKNWNWGLCHGDIYTGNIHWSN